MKNIKILWKTDEDPKWRPGGRPYSHVLKIEYFDVKIFGQSLLSDPARGEQAEVEITYSYREDNKDKAAYQKVTGKSGEVFNYMIANTHASRDLFISTWNIQKDRRYKSMTGIVNPFRQANTAEKLTKLTFEAGMNTQKFAEKTKKDPANLFRELKGTKQLGLKQAIEYSKHLDCDPVDLLFEDLRCDVWGHVDFYKKNEIGNETYKASEIFPVVASSVVVPRNIYTPNIKAIRCVSEGSFLQNQLIFYKRTDTDSARNGKLVIAGKRIDTLAEFGYEPVRYFLGIYEVQRGGKTQILPVDPFVEDNTKPIATGDFEFVAPVLAVVSPSASKRDEDYYELNRQAEKLFKIQRQQIELQEAKLKAQQAELNDRLAKNMQDLKRKIDLFEENVKETTARTPDWLKKRA